MIIKVKNEVEMEMNIPVPFASKTEYGSYSIVDEQGSVIQFNDNLICRFKHDAYQIEKQIQKAMDGKIISMREAEEKYSEVLASFQQLQLAY